jgi:hypothetical protein
VAAPAELEQIIRAELRQPIEHLVRQVVVELVATAEGLELGAVFE